MSDPRLIGEGMSEETRAMLAKVGDGKVRPTGPNGRMRYCTKCERESTEYMRLDPKRGSPRWRTHGRASGSRSTGATSAQAVPRLREAPQRGHARRDAQRRRKPQAGAGDASCEGLGAVE